MLYNVFVTLHSVLRWLIVLIALFAIIRAATGISFKRGWMQMDNRAGLWFTSLLDLQVLVGAILYFFLSPTTAIVLRNFGAAMGDPATRFFGIEHILGMLVAVVVAHVGRSLVRKAPAPMQKHRRAAISIGLTLLIVLAAIPWPFLSYGRPLI
jgi:hypothetical protein